MNQLAQDIPTQHKPPVKVVDVPTESGGGYPEPFRSRMGIGDWRPLGNFFGLTQFGINLETLQPGAQSALRHWHSMSDEFVYVVDGEFVLRTNTGERMITAGMCV